MMISLLGLLLVQSQPLFSIDDYPAEALRRGEQGTVEVDLLITTAMLPPVQFVQN